VWVWRTFPPDTEKERGGECRDLLILGGETQIGRVRTKKEPMEQKQRGVRASKTIGKGVPGPHIGVGTGEKRGREKKSKQKHSNKTRERGRNPSKNGQGRLSHIQAKTQK